MEAPCQVIATKDDDIESSKSDSGTLKIKEEISVKDESQNSDKVYNVRCYICHSVCHIAASDLVLDHSVSP